MQESFYSYALKSLVSISTVILLGLVVAYHWLLVQVSYAATLVDKAVAGSGATNARPARLVPGWVTVFGRFLPSRYVISQLGQLSLASLRGRLIEYQLRLG